MIRYTPKDKKMRECNSFCADAQYDEALCYLGDLEDFEEKMGATFLVLYRALTEGAWFKEGDKTFFSKGVTLKVLFGQFVIIGFSEIHFVSNYRKSWALCKEDLE